MTKILSKEIAFNGRLRTDIDGASIAPSDFQVLQNLRYTDTNVRGVLGHTKVNTTVLANTAIRNGIHFRKDRPSESHVLVDANGNCYDNAAVVPAQGNFGASIYEDPSGATLGRYAIAPTGLLARCNGKEALLFGGTKYRCAGFVDNPTTGELFDYTDQVANLLDDANNLAIIHTSAPVSDYIATFYVGSVLPLKGVYFDMNTANDQETTMVVNYYNGTEWTAVSALDDGTDSGGISLAQDGWVTFDSTVDVAKVYSINKVFIYWYQFVVTGAVDFNGVPKINTVYVDLPMQPIKDIWDGDAIPCASNLMYYSSLYHDVTSRVIDDYYDNSETAGTTIPKTFVNYGNDIGSTGYAYFGFPVRTAGLQIAIGSTYENVVASTIDTIEYWNGDTWTSIKDSLSDGTLTGGKTFGQTGWITWTPPSSNSEKPIVDLPAHKSVSPKLGGTSIDVSKDAPLYYYRTKFTAALANASAYAVRVYYVAGIPAQEDIRGYRFPLSHAGRLFLCNNVDGWGNEINYSSVSTANVFNGLDSGKLYAGGDEALVAGASLYNRFGSTLTNIAVFCKAGETFILQGEEPATWKLFQVSDKIGCVAPLSMQTISMPSKESQSAVSSNAAIWVSTRGVEMFSGASITEISGDISDLFDPSQATYLGAAAIASITSVYDPILNEYHMIVPGSYEYVLDLKRGKWFQIVRGTELYGGFAVSDTNGYKYVYGFGNAGFVFRLEYGTTFNGTAIAHVLRTGDMAFPEGSVLEYSGVNWFGLVMKAKTTTDQSVASVYYNDTGASSSNSNSISQSRSGYRLINAQVHEKGKESTFHGFQFSVSTDDEAIGFEPLYMTVRFTVYPRQLS